MKYVWSAATAVVLAALMGPRVESCEQMFADMWFTTYHGALPGEFENGRVGVLRPHYYRPDLLMAYRTLSGVRMSVEEKARPAEQAGIRADAAGGIQSLRSGDGTGRLSGQLVGPGAAEAERHAECHA